MRPHAGTLFSFALALLIAAALHATTPQEPAAGLRVDVQLVNVFATVTDASGAYVSGLEKDDFILEEDGSPQPIAHFSRDVNNPVSVGILVDTSASMQNKLRTAVSAIDRFIRNIHPDDDIFVMSFSSNIDLRQDFTDDRERLSRAMKSLNATGATVLYDALEESILKMRAGRHQKRALLLITDGKDTGSAVTLREVRQDLRESELLVYPLGISAPRSRSSNDGIDIQVLETLARDTGGRAFLLSDILIGSSGTQIERILSQIAEELRSQYTLAFYPRHREDGRFHSIEVRARFGLNVRTRPGYIAR